MNQDFQEHTQPDALTKQTVLLTVFLFFTLFFTIMIPSPCSYLRAGRTSQLTGPRLRKILLGLAVNMKILPPRMPGKSSKSAPERRLGHALSLPCVAHARPSPGSLGHPEFCSRPCVYVTKGGSRSFECLQLRHARCLSERFVMQLLPPRARQCSEVGQATANLGPNTCAHTCCEHKCLSALPLADVFP